MVMDLKQRESDISVSSFAKCRYIFLRKITPKSAADPLGYGQRTLNHQPGEEIHII